jgi:hypothetical protein
LYFSGYMGMEIYIYDEDGEEIASDTASFKVYNASGVKYEIDSAEIDVSSINAGRTYKIRRKLWLNISFAYAYHDYTYIQRKDHDATAQYTSQVLYWEDTVSYDRVVVNCTLNGESGTLLIEVSDDNFSTTKDSWSQALEDGENTYEFSAALDDSKYIRAKVTLNSADGSESPELNSVKVFPS